MPAGASRAGDHLKTDLGVHLYVVCVMRSIKRCAGSIPSMASVPI